MQEFIVHLRSALDVNEFVALAAPLCAVALSDNLRSVDGKNFMEIFCLQLPGPLTVTVSGTEEQCRAFKEGCGKFMGTH